MQWQNPHLLQLRSHQPTLTGPVSAPILPLPYYCRCSNLICTPVDEVHFQDSLPAAAGQPFQLFSTHPTFTHPISSTKIIWIVVYETPALCLNAINLKKFLTIWLLSKCTVSCFCTAWWELDLVGIWKRHYSTSPLQIYPLKTGCIYHYHVSIIDVVLELCQHFCTVYLLKM